MKTSQKLKDLFSHRKALEKFLNNINKEHQTKDFKSLTIFILIGASITQENNKPLNVYKIPELATLLKSWYYLRSFKNQYPIYREHKTLLKFGLVERVTTKASFKNQSFNVSIYGKMKLRSLYNYLIRESFPSTIF